MICNKCGNSLPDESKFCQYCGNKLLTAEDTIEKDVIKSSPEISEDKNATSVTLVTNDKGATDKSETNCFKTQKVKYCKNCGGKIDPSTKICTSCGRQYFHVERSMKVILLSTMLIVLVGSNILQFFHAKNVIENLNETIEYQKSELISKDKTIDEKTLSIAKLRSKESEYKSIYSKLRGANIGYASSHFNSDRSIIVVPSWTTEVFTLTANWYSGGTVITHYDGDSAKILFDNDSWAYSTNLTVVPKHAGPTVVTFSNSVDNETFKILIIVTD